MTQPANFQVTGLGGIPLVAPGDDLAQILWNALEAQSLQLLDGDIVCVAQKVVSKSEGRLVPLATVTPSPAALALGIETDKDPRLVELILSETDEVLRSKPGVLIVRHKLGFTMANAGVDQSNVDHNDGENALLLPEDPDASALRLRDELASRAGADIGVLITDSANRPWRMGTTGIAIGAAGFTVLDDRRGGEDMFGRELKVTLMNQADAIAAAATLVMGETTEGVPAALLRGLKLSTKGQNASIINRPLEEDLFR